MITRRGTSLLRTRRDYGEDTNDQDEWMSRSEVASVCPLCAEKMDACGVARVRASVIRDAQKKSDKSPDDSRTQALPRIAATTRDFRSKLWHAVTRAIGMPPIKEISEGGSEIDFLTEGGLTVSFKIIATPNDMGWDDVRLDWESYWSGGDRKGKGSIPIVDGPRQYRRWMTTAVSIFKRQIKGSDMNGKIAAKELVAVAELVAGRSTTPRYVFEPFPVFSRYRMDRMEWRSQYGRPSRQNIQRFVEKTNESMEPGGANSHLGMRGAIYGGRILDQFNGMEVVAEWEDRGIVRDYKSRPAFEVIGSARIGGSRVAADKYPLKVKRQYGHVGEKEDGGRGELPARLFIRDGKWWLEFSDGHLTDTGKAARRPSGSSKREIEKEITASSHTAFTLRVVKAVPATYMQDGDQWEIVFSDGRVLSVIVPYLASNLSIQDRNLREHHADIHVPSKIQDILEDDSRYKRELARWFKSPAVSRELAEWLDEYDVSGGAVES